MKQKSIMAAAVIFVLWSLIDFVMHGFILGSAYARTAFLWRPMEEMNAWLIYLVTAVTVAVFTAIYALFIRERKMAVALLYGLLFGIALGFPMGYGSYATMPIPLVIARTWFFGTLVKTALGGAVLGGLVKE